VNSAAYELYLKGRFQLNKFTPDGFHKGLALLHQAVAIDPSEPLTYAALAHGYSLLELFGPPSPDASKQAKAAALKAVELDDEAAEAHAALGLVLGSKEYDHARSTASVRRALELNPNVPEPHIYYSWDRAIGGTPDEAIAEMKRAIELDPLSALYTAWLGGLYWEFGRFEDAVVEANKAMELQADFPVALFVLGLAQLDLGHPAEAIAAHEKAVAKYPGQNFTWTLARTYALTGRPRDARRILARLDTPDPGDGLHPWFIAAAYTALGEDDLAMDWLERGYAERSTFLPNLLRERAAGATFGRLHSNPRFRALVARLNLPN
jgi:tetratricopeptide (TPR) repeat protein